MIFVVLAAAAMQPPQTSPAEDGPIVRQQVAIPIPREIAPVVMPYIQCLTNAFRDEGDETPIVSAAIARSAQQRALANCIGARAQVRAAALDLLSRSSLDRPDREALVDRGLVSIDGLNDSVIQRFEAWERNPQD